MPGSDDMSAGLAGERAVLRLLGRPFRPIHFGPTCFRPINFVQS